MRGVRTEIMRNRFGALVEEASIILYRTAHTTFIKQTQDYQCAMCTTEGEVFAYPRFNGVATLVGLSLKPVIDAIGPDNMQPGDVIITNDPFSTEGVCTHTPDVFVIRPIFYRGVLQCYSWAFAHVSDMGGAVPSSISPGLTEIFQEGLRLRPVRLYARDVPNTDLLGIIRDNCRIPDETWGDIKAMCSALASMDRRIVELCDRYGADELQAGIDGVLDYAESKARAVVADLPEGTYAFSDYLEVVPGEPLMLHCTMTVAGDAVTLDFSGSSPQVQAACNFVTGAKPHPALVRCFVAFLLSATGDMPMNGGIVRPIRVVAPKGIMMNAEFPAASGNRAATYTRVYDIVLGCLNQAVEGALAAGGGSQAAIIAASTIDSRTQRPRVSVIQPLIGGSGGRRGLDGIDAIDTPFGFLRSAPVESVEHEMPLFVRRFGLVRDTFGAGRWRGGAALEIEMENLAGDMTFSVRGCDRFTFQPWGVAGGAPGHCGAGWKNGDPASLIEVHRLRRHDRLHLRSPAGGGFGDPAERDPAAVLADVDDGLLSVESAARDYGVIVVHGQVDIPATQDARIRLRRQAQPFAYGTRRTDYERDWPVDATLAMARALLTLPLAERSPARAWIRHHCPTDATPDRISALIAEWTRLEGAA